MNDRQEQLVKALADARGAAGRVTEGCSMSLVLRAEHELSELHDVESRQALDAEVPWQTGASLRLGYTVVTLLAVADRLGVDMGSAVIYELRRRKQERDAV